MGDLPRRTFKGGYAVHRIFLDGDPSLVRTSKGITDSCPPGDLDQFRTAWGGGGEAAGGGVGFIIKNDREEIGGSIVAHRASAPG